MKRNLQVVVNKVNVVVVSVVVILVVIVTVVSSVRVIGMENISISMATENIIAAAPETSGVSEIAGVVVVNPKDVGGPVHVQRDVALPVGSNISLGRIHISRYLGGDHVGNYIIQRAQINDGIDINGNIAMAAITRIATSGIDAGISSVDTAGAALIAEINAAPISGNYIGAGEADLIAQIDNGAARNIGDGDIMDIAAARIIDRSGNIERIS